MTDPLLVDILKNRFGHCAFRHGQQPACEALAGGHDVCAILPTGGGKSLCYQLPALWARSCGRGPTVVVSPLIALMDDQVRSLVERGIRARALHSGQDALEQRATAAQLRTGKLDLLYVSPERAVLPHFIRWVAEAQPAYLAIDEAHCISQWGHDFRPEYRKLMTLRRVLGVPTAAVTATATPQVCQDIALSLGLTNPVWVRGSFARSNLAFAAYEVRREVERLSFVVAAVRAKSLHRSGGGRALIYCATRKSVYKVYRALRDEGIAAGYYHAGRSDSARSNVQQGFTEGKICVLVATNAFGMGIDLPDIRLVVHFHAPGSVEAYYQEAGRAGRDGAPAHCVLLYGARDFVMQRLIKGGGGGSSGQGAAAASCLEAMRVFASSAGCRQILLCAHFGEDVGDLPCGRCDKCTDGRDWQRLFEGCGSELGETARAATARSSVTKVEPLADAQAALVLNAVQALKRPVGKVSLARALRGSQSKATKRAGLCRLPQHGQLARYSEASIAATIDELLLQGIVRPAGRKYPTIWLAGRPIRAAFRSTSDVADPEQSPGLHPGSSRSRARTSAGGHALARALRAYRRKTARRLKWRPFMVFHNAVIDQIASDRPSELWQLEHIKGLGPAKVGRFGADILELVGRYKG